MRDPEKLDPRIRVVFSNKAAIEDWLGRAIDHTPPSSNAEHYPHKYKWDMVFATILKSRSGFSASAAAEILDLFKGQRPDGLVPSPQFIEKGRDIDLERESFTDRNNSNYGQPPIEALAALETYKGLAAEGKTAEAAVFLHGIYPNLKASYDYFGHDRQHRDPRIKLIFNIHPHETGRDSDPVFDFYKSRPPRFGKDTPDFINEANRVIDYFSVIALGERHRANGWSTQEIRRYFEFYDVMFNCMYAENLYLMGDIAEKLALQDRDHEPYKAEAASWRRLAAAAEEQILDYMWFEREGQNGLFLNRLPGRPVKEISVGNLFPLILPNLREEQLESLLDLIDKCFMPVQVQLPIPSVPPINPFSMRPNRKYDPDHGERDRLWRGPTWMNTNWYLVERGLNLQASRADLQRRPDLISRCQSLTQFISERSYKVVEGLGFWEFYNPETTRPLRTDKSPNFFWPGLVYLLERKYLT